LELTNQEASLKEMSKKLDQLEHQKAEVVPQHENVADDYEKLGKRTPIAPKSTPAREVLAKSTPSVSSENKRDIRALLLKAYDQLGSSDMTALQVTYNKIRDSYAKMAAKTGQDEQLYKDIIDLYSDIKLAVVHKS
jgi:hypothetical protein